MNEFDYMGQPIPQVQRETKVTTGEGTGLNLDFFTKGNPTVKNERDQTLDEPEKKKRGRPRKREITAGEIEANNRGLDKAYSDSYEETTNLLRGSIMQIDMLSNEIKSDIDSVRASKTLRNKYSYIADLTSTSGNLLNTKISAIREINKSITDAHNLEMKRNKELNLNSEDDDKRIMDMYAAFVNTPMGSYNPLGPNMVDVNMAGTGAPRVDIVGNNGGDVGYDAYRNNLTPEQNRMILERNPNIKTVVVYNQETGEKFFDVIDMSTGASVPNVARPDSFLLPDTNINLRAGVARNANIDTTWPLMVIGNNISINDY